MKIRCIALLSPDGKPIEFSPWLTLGAVYHVLSFLIDAQGKRLFQIVTNEKCGGVEFLAYFPGACFEIVTEFRPSCWREREIGGAVEMSPISWQSPGFLESLYDGEPESTSIFERECEKIFREEP